ncbi:hypothetical protein ACFV98_17925 [Streptomyces violascens]|uniref:hypothetical protein n=1 Tax=Streptomyces violascens TaxID=67381 RepID=UPI003666F92F
MRVWHERRGVLRRVSNVVLSWGFTFSFGISGLLCFLVAGVDSRPASGPVSGAAACFFTVAVGRRFFGSRVVLGEQIVVINPVFTYRIPCGAVVEARADARGSLVILCGDGATMYASAFGGALMDHWVGSTARAAKAVNDYRRSAGKRSSSASAVRSVTRAWTADVFLVAGVASAVAAVYLGM